MSLLHRDDWTAHLVEQAAIEGNRVRRTAARAAAPLPRPSACCWPMWPHGARPGPRPQFCGEPAVGGSYCEAHAQRASVARKPEGT